MPSGNKPLPELMLAKFYVTDTVSLGSNELKDVALNVNMQMI